MEIYLKYKVIQKSEDGRSKSISITYPYVHSKGLPSKKELTKMISQSITSILKELSNVKGLNNRVVYIRLSEVQLKPTELDSLVFNYKSKLKNDRNK